MQELIKALIKAKAEFNPIQKDGTNPHYKRKYATLDAVLDAVTPALGKHGLVIIQTTEIFEGKTVLRTHVFHESGESIISNSQFAIRNYYSITKVRDLDIDTTSKRFFSN
ncbi:hypothetical protein ANSO36C_64450 (plasmid) [Nostoc cf. commune SO-36]|uniref:ERF family protein n=1 Tax=Nostoc cf. commune SO-36 TaxID=449208 RepID=A0ABM7ZBH4_NOSCO|nr:ERF family protein [Nostoc commune]BDI20643.1 hypothetical protein ANSO36C_64450 [Nostoc cf. commune SO-36]